MDPRPVDYAPQSEGPPMLVSNLQYVIWGTIILCHLGVLLFMHRRGLRQSFPHFFNYNIYQILSSVALFILLSTRAPQKTYFIAFWTSNAVSMLLGLAVIQEAFSYAIRPYAGLRELSVTLFRWVALLMVLVGAVIAASMSGSSLSKMTWAIVTMERSTRLLQCGLLLFLFVCSSHLGIKLRNFVCGIALGFGIFAVTDLMIATMQPRMGPMWMSTLNLIRSGVYVLAATIWCSYSALPKLAQERVKNDFTFEPVLDRWNQAAMLVMTPATAAIASDHTYISDIDKAVQDVMEKNRA